jgi:NAD(P)-dependent dehydrogenase (short-subunit alcohol dehydrogenase family)
MLLRQSALIIFVTATLARGVISQIAGSSVTFAAVEGLSRCLATEWSPSGIRAVCIHSAGMLDSSSIQQTLKAMGETIGLSKDEFADSIKQAFLLKRWPVLNDIGKIATFVASDRASTITGAIINATCGHVLDS